MTCEKGVAMIDGIVVNLSKDYDGNVVCWQWWQHGLLAFNVIFVGVLYLGSGKLYNRAISWKQFIGACIVPLPFLVTGLLNVHTPNRGENQPLRIDTPAFRRFLTMEMPHMIAKNAPTRFPIFCLALSVHLVRMIKGRSTGKAF